MIQTNKKEASLLIVRSQIYYLSKVMIDLFYFDQKLFKKQKNRNQSDNFENLIFNSGKSTPVANAVMNAKPIEGIKY